jgi:uncharacterized MAPEG superfamily protein
MTFALWSVLLVALLPIIWVGVAKTGADGYDNHKPRIFLAGLTDWAQRANWAQANAYEAFPPFAAAVIIAHIMGGNQLASDLLAGSFLILRILHGIFYIQNKATLRSAVWSLSFMCVIGLFLNASWAN